MRRAPKAQPEHFSGTDFSSVFGREMKEWVQPVDERRERRRTFPSPGQPDVENELVGLALSGGGIRSATFSLGACQALARSGVWERVDYLSTVSGGTYFGSAISSLLHWASEVGPGHPLPAENFPFRFGPEPGSELRHFKAERPTVRRLREMSNYLAPRLGLLDTQTWYALIRVVTHAVLLLLFFALPPIVLVLAALTAVPSEIWARSRPLSTPDVVFYPLYLAGAAFLAFALIQSSTLGRGTFLAGLARRLLYVVLGALAWVAFVFAVSAAGDAGTWYQRAFGAGALGLVAASRWAYGRLGEIGAKLDSELGAGSLGKWFRMTLPQVLFGLLGYLVLALLVVLLYVVLHQLVLSARLAVAAVAGVFTLGTLTWPGAAGRLNAWSLHSFYRDRLGEAYIQHEMHDEGENEESRRAPKLHAALGELQAEKVTSGAKADRPLGELQKVGRTKVQVLGPYHVIGSALNISGSTDVKLLGRKADAFFLAPLYSGASITGFVRTDEAYGKLSLGDAMAISGSAFSPNQGSSTRTSLAILLTLLNARLGYWLPNPLSFDARNDGEKSEDSEERTGKEVRKGRRLTSSMPLLLYWKEMFGKASSDDGVVYLSDGGHFDNSGIYELVRRRCRYIIAIDGSGEPALDPPRFDTLGIVSRLVRIDFGVDIQLDLASLIPDANNRTATYFAIGRVEYPRTEEGEADSERTGLLIYLKSTLTREQTAPDLEFYRRSTGVFPNHSTADQFFDEGQFESYRELGYQAARAVFRGPLEFPKTQSDGWLGQALCDRWNRDVMHGAPAGA